MKKIMTMILTNIKALNLLDSPVKTVNSTPITPGFWAGSTDIILAIRGIIILIPRKSNIPAKELKKINVKKFLFTFSPT